MSQENATSKQPLIRPINRQQMSWRAVDVERLIGEDHRARAIWTLVGRLDLQQFYDDIESSAEQGGRPAFDPQLLISLWVYAYSEGIGSAREVARRCEFDPAFQWLTGLEEVNYHTLASFRVEKQQELDELFTQLLGVLSAEGLITLEQVMQDGTKIKALASTRSYQREATIREHLERARQRVAEMGDPQDEESRPKAQQARARARQEQQKRLENALQELEKLQEGKKGEKAKSQARVSTRSRSASDETIRWRIGPQLQRADFHRCGARIDRGSSRDAGGRRQRSVTAGGRPYRTAAEENAATNGGRWRLYHPRQHREDGQAGNRFSGKHGAGRDAQRSDGPEPTSAQCVRLSTGDESVCLPGGQAAAAPRASQQQEAGDRHLSLRSKIQRLSTLHP